MPPIPMQDTGQWVARRADSFRQATDAYKAALPPVVTYMYAERTPQDLLPPSHVSRIPFSRWYSLVASLVKEIEFAFLEANTLDGLSWGRLVTSLEATKRRKGELEKELERTAAPCAAD